MCASHCICELEYVTHCTRCVCAGALKRPGIVRPKAFLSRFRKPIVFANWMCMFVLCGDLLCGCASKDVLIRRRVFVLSNAITSIDRARSIYRMACVWCNVVCVILCQISDNNCTAICCEMRVFRCANLLSKSNLIRNNGHPSCLLFPTVLGQRYWRSTFGFSFQFHSACFSVAHYAKNMRHFITLSSNYEQYSPAILSMEWQLNELMERNFRARVTSKSSRNCTRTPITMIMRWWYFGTPLSGLNILVVLSCFFVVAPCVFVSHPGRSGVNNTQLVVSFARQSVGCGAAHRIRLVDLHIYGLRCSGGCGLVCVSGGNVWHSLHLGDYAIHMLLSFEFEEWWFYCCQTGQTANSTFLREHIAEI